MQKKSKNYSYIFESLAALCDVLTVKYGLGVRTRRAYLSKDKVALQNVVKEYSITERKLEIFYRKFRALWYKENNPTGFDVQDIRLGGLMQRLRSCRERLEEFIAGEIDIIPELEEEILNYRPELDSLGYFYWSGMATTNVL